MVTVDEEEMIFDEEAYKIEHNYYGIYNAYLADVTDAVQHDPQSVEGDYNDPANWNVVDMREENDYPWIEMSGIMQEDYKLEENQAQIRQIYTDVTQSYTVIPGENYQALADFYEQMSIAKKEAEQAYTDAQGKKADADAGNNPDEQQQAEPEINAEEAAAQQAEQEAREAFEKNIKTMYEAWDPRLQRIDYFFMNSKKPDEVQQMVRIPFSSYTAATAFQDQAWVLEAQVAADLLSEYGIGNKTGVAENVGIYKLLKGEKNEQIFGQMPASQKIVMQNQDIFTSDNRNWGVQSIVNPYSLTKLVGGLEVTDGGVMNYMYDIRDRRRFYGLNMVTDDVLAIDNPTVTQLIEYGNQDAWGRTPYTFQDFVYCKYFGLIPNNRLITLRRYAVPTYDNLQFENMFGDHNTTEYDEKTGKRTVKNNTIIESELNTGGKVFSPHASVITWFGGDTGNTLSSLMNFTTGIPWDDLKSQIYQVTGEEGETAQSVIDRLLENGGEHLNLFGSAEHSGITALMQRGSWVSGKTTSFGKFSLAMNGKVEQDQAAYDKLALANRDPYDQTYRNRIKGPVNRIDSIKKRKEGIEFQQTLTIKCQYMTKAIGGINPKAALLDVMGNCLEMVSPHAVFWGGGHHFQIKPQIYPWHDNGWRDSFMQRLYDGKILGNDGAVNTVLKGLKLVGEDGNGGFNMDTLKSTLGQMGGDALSLVGAAINGIAGIFGGGGLLGNLSDLLNDKGAELAGTDAATAKATATARITNMFSNLKQLWSNKMVATTIQPNISGMGGLLIGEPVGEWHMTVGNPLNPIMVIGNLICKSAKFTWNEELGPDDFPTGFEVEYTLEHGMPRDSDGIQSMFNRGMGKFYTLPDYMALSSEKITEVDEYTGDGSGGDSGTLKWIKSGQLLEEANKYGGGNQVYRISAGKAASNAGNYDTRLLTKFTPLNDLPSNTLSINAIRSGTNNTGTTAIIRSRAATRKMLGN